MREPADDDSRRAPITYAPDTILTTEQVADWLQVSQRHVELMNLPRLKGLGRAARNEAGALLHYLTGRWMPHRANGRGSLIVKRKFPGVPLIRRATGTNDPRVAERIDLMYRALYDQARVDILEAIAEGRLHPLKVLSQWRRGKEIMLPSEEVLESLRALAQ